MPAVAATKVDVFILGEINGRYPRGEKEIFYKHGPCRKESRIRRTGGDRKRLSSTLFASDNFETAGLTLFRLGVSVPLEPNITNEQLHLQLLLPLFFKLNKGN